jgi:hypothetical protein
MHEASQGSVPSTGERTEGIEDGREKEGKAKKKKKKRKEVEKKKLKKLVMLFSLPVWSYNMRILEIISHLAYYEMLTSRESVWKVGGKLSIYLTFICISNFIFSYFVFKTILHRHTFEKMNLQRKYLLKSLEN